LNAQTEFLENPSARSAIQESRERMEAIAIITRTISNGKQTLVQVRAYVYELWIICKTVLANATDIRFQLNIADIVLDISQSMPLGLILNELLQMP